MMEKFLKAQGDGLRNIVLLVLLSGAFFFAGNNVMDLTNPDEVFYVQTAREMVQKASWNVPYLFDQPQFEKPIGVYWFLRVSFLLFGETNFSARFFPAFFAGLGVLLVYWMACLGFGDRRKAFLSALILMSSVFYIGMGRTVFTDMIFSVSMLFSLAAFFWAYQVPARKTWGIVLAFLFAGLAVLTKGPLGLVLPAFVVAIFLFCRKELRFLLCPAVLAGFLLFWGVALPWYVFVIKKYGVFFTHEFFYNDHWRRLIIAEHRSNDKFYFYPLSMLGCMFPWTFFMGAAFVWFASRLKNKESLLAVEQFCLIWIAVVFVVFQIAHSKLVSYILPLFPAMGILAGDYIDTFLRHEKGKTIGRLFKATGIFFFVIPIILLIGLWKYPVYLPSPVKVLGVAAFYIVLFSTGLFFLFKKKYRAGVYFLAAQPLLILMVALGSYQHFGDYVSSKNAAQYLAKNYSVNNIVICSKMFLRGVSLYTDKNVAVINANGSNFFSPHPVVTLNAEEKLKDFLRSQAISYALVNRTYYNEIKRVALGMGLQCDLLKVIGDEYIVRVQAKATGL
ncbi:MAG: glycosyltransferase family 39 protein [Candidatus Omnitrophica bacterium]|nr:glycosyltransferase family 39 protein [Candidatus Omnitrophota bacterium]